MLLSMTGYGSGRIQEDGFAVSVEIRALNNRYLKVSTKAVEPYNVYESEIERLVRKRIARGTVHVSLRIERKSSPDEFRLNPVAVQSYLDQIKPLAGLFGGQPSIDQVLALPGVVIDGRVDSRDPMDDWPRIAVAVEAALNRLHAMRVEEGLAMHRELHALCKAIGRELETVAARIPRVVEAYRDRLHERIQALLDEFGVSVDPSELIKEVAIFAERSDIAEEVVRLRSHLEHFAAELNGSESNGRKLEFVGQEMFREVNTIGSKANDIEISRYVVEMKGAIERIRELMQNVE